MESFCVCGVQAVFYPDMEKTPKITDCALVQNVSMDNHFTKTLLSAIKTWAETLCA